MGQLAQEISTLRRSGRSSAEIAVLLDLTPDLVAQYSLDSTLPDAPIRGASDIAFAFAQIDSYEVPALVSGEYHNVALNGYNGWTTVNDTDTFLPVDGNLSNGGAYVEGPLRILRPGVYNLFFQANTASGLGDVVVPDPRLSHAQDEIFGSSPPPTRQPSGDPPNRTFQWAWQRTYVGNITVAPVDLYIPWVGGVSVPLSIAQTLFIQRVGEVAGTMTSQ